MIRREFHLQRDRVMITDGNLVELERSGFDCTTYISYISDILSGMQYEVYSDISGMQYDVYSNILSGILSIILSDIYFGILSDIYSGILSGKYSDMHFGIDFAILFGG